MSTLCRFIVGWRVDFLLPSLLDCLLAGSMLFGSADGKEQLLRILFLLFSLFFKLSVSKISNFALFHCKMTEMLFLLLQRFPVDIIEILFVNIFSRGLESLQQESYLATFCIGVALLMNNEA